MATLFFLPSAILSQNLEKIGKKDMVTIGGGMNFNSIFYNAQGFPSRRDPYTWYFNGNLNISILDVSLPFTYSYSNLHGAYTQPFNMQSCSPKYKWAQGHIGTTAMNFSSYTLAGHIFTGGGIELTPDGFYFGAMYGRLNKAEEYDATTNSSANMSFRRMGMAGKIGYDKDGNSICVTYFTAKDDPASLLFIRPGSNLSPAQNSALSISGKTKFLKFFSAEGEFAISGLTRNIYSGMETTDFNGLEKFIMPTKSSTQFFKAYKGAVAYAGKKVSISLNHEHVDSDYQTFGAYYFNNDLDNWTIAPAFHLMNGKLSLAFNTGWQHNNLDGTKLTTAHRWVASANISFTPNAKWTFISSYSNFTSYTNRRLQSDPFWQSSPADTLSFYQIAQQANCSVIHSFGKKSTRQSISLIGSYQLTGTQQNLSEASNATVLNGNLCYSIQLIKTKTSISLISNYNRSVSGILLTELFGPGLQCSQSFRKGTMRISGGSSYNQSYTNAILTSNILSHRAQFSYSPKMKKRIYGKPSLSVSAIYVNRFP
ncbi:MAG TPA: hypothetical protein VFJ43_15610, partial [Bacteroidia bacterium]|nr:hypothetical protein [Bacteroidia bacterium]